MALGERITSWIAAMHPLLALVGLFGAFAAAGLFGPGIGSPPPAISAAVSAAVMAVAVIGYPVAIASHLAWTRGAVTRVNPAVMAVAMLIMLVAYATMWSFFVRLSPRTPSLVLVTSGASFAWVASLLYIFWTAARGLVYAEEGRAVAFSRVVGTFFMFYFLPLGIYFLQRRVRRLTDEIENSPRAA